jgi:hypothetical protein
MITGRKNGRPIEVRIALFMVVLSFSRWLTLRLPGLKEGKKTPREGFSYPTPDSDLSNGDEFEKISPVCQD